MLPELLVEPPVLARREAAGEPSDVVVAEGDATEIDEALEGVPLTAGEAAGFAPVCEAVPAACAGIPELALGGRTEVRGEKERVLEHSWSEECGDEDDDEDEEESSKK